jgi:twinkle protein
MLLTAKEIAQKLADDVEGVCLHLLPNGKRLSGEWCVGSVDGEEGKSLKVRLTGARAGVWADFASGGKGGDLLDLWAQTRHVSLGDAIREAKAYLGIHDPGFANERPRTYRKPDKPACRKPKEGAVAEYLRVDRGLMAATVSAYRVAASEDDDEIVFPYLRDGELLNVKYLKLERPDGKKIVRQEKDAEPCLFGWQAIPDNARTVVLTEGEIDAMTWWQMGYPALSVWSGAGNVQWIDNEYENLARFDSIYLAFDNDDAGKKGAALVIDRLGRDRCYVITTPHKDANECLMQGLGAADFRKMVQSARSLDPEELRATVNYLDEVLRMFHPSDSAQVGFSTPFDRANLNGAMFGFGELVLVNGINGHGKTKLLTQIMLSAARQGLRGCIASMEVRPALLLKSMTIQAAARRDPSDDFIRAIFEWERDKMWMFAVTGVAKADRLIETFLYARRKYGVRAFYLDSLLKCGIAEDDYEGQKRFVERLCDFKNETASTVFLVTHSRKLESEMRVVDKMDVRGAGAIIDLADTITTLWRNKPKERAIERGEGNPDEHDAVWFWQKNRNGDFEGSVPLWYDPDAFQFRDQRTERSKPFVPFSAQAPREGVEIE